MTSEDSAWVIVDGFRFPKPEEGAAIDVDSIKRMLSAAPRIASEEWSEVEKRYRDAVLKRFGEARLMRQGCVMPEGFNAYQFEEIRHVSDRHTVAMLRSDWGELFVVTRPSLPA